MLSITTIATGKCKDKSTLALEAEYAKRLNAFARYSVTELHQSKAQTAELIKKQEAEKQLLAIPNDAFVIALDEKGEHLKTAALAQKLAHEQNTGNSHFCFIIGGAEGLAPSVTERANLTLSLSKLTFPHMLVRVLLAEQLYRALSLNAGHPYHRE
tara:strand:+ start:242 stop:709 length:468 start_codon:yes stop_codon:yes gene_type:complete